MQGFWAISFTTTNQNHESEKWFYKQCCKLGLLLLQSDSKPAANMGLAIVGGQWLIEALCFVSTFVLADIFVLLNARHRQAPHRLVAIFRTP